MNYGKSLRVAVTSCVLAMSAVPAFAQMLHTKVAQGALVGKAEGVVAAYLGAQLTHRLPAAVLKKVFAVFLAFAGFRILLL